MSNRLKSHVGLQQIASRLGLSISTVSSCLRGDPRFAEKTRALVTETARSMGYRPDPMLSALANYRSSKNRHTVHSSLAWLHPNVDEAYLKKRHRVWATLSGAKKRAADFGYGIAEFRASGQEQMLKIQKTIHSRGIEGMMLFADGPVSPFPVHEHIDISNMAMVSINYPEDQSPFHTVSPHYFRSTLRVLDEFSKRGCKRIGLVLFNNFDLHSNHLVRAAFAYRSQVSPEWVWLPPLISNKDFTGAEILAQFRQWLYNYCPDAILTETWNLMEGLQQLGVQVPEELDFALIETAHASGVSSGIFEMPETIGATAVEQLIALIQRREFGAPETVRHVMIEGAWIDNATTRSRQFDSEADKKSYEAEQAFVRTLPFPPKASWNPAVSLPDLGYGPGRPLPKLSKAWQKRRRKMQG